MQFLTQRILVAALAAILAACGGGGGGGDPKAVTGGDPKTVAGGDPKTVTGGDPKTVTGGDPSNMGGGTDTTINKTSAAFITRPATGSAPRPGTVADTTAASIADGLPTGPNGNKAAIGTFSDAERNQIIKDGLIVWRAQRIDINGIDKGACANCHSADGFELAMWDFHDNDVRRRAHIDGVNEKDRELLVRYFAALRQKYDIKTLKSIKDDRPFQPGPKGDNKVIGGNTKAERDYTFALTSLKTALPTLVDGDIDSFKTAKQAKDELSDSNPLKLKIGIEMPRMSEDCFRGSDHCSLNDWMADLPRFPIPAREAEWFKINDAYIDNPTPANLRAVLSATDSMTKPWVNPGEPEGGGPAATLGTTKFKSMQILQHVLRTQQLNKVDPELVKDPLYLVRGLEQKRPNAPFLVGDFGFDKHGPKWISPDQMPTFVRNGLGEHKEYKLTGIPQIPGTTDDERANNDVARIKDTMFTPWWYMGFILDSNMGTGTGTEYFFGSLSTNPQGGYPFHRYYVVGRHGSITEGRQETVDKKPLTPKVRTDYNLAYLGAGGGDEDDISRLYTSVAARQLYRKMQVNWTLGWMYLMRQQIIDSGLGSLNKEADIDRALCPIPGTKTGDTLREWVRVATAMDGTRAERVFNLYNDLMDRTNCTTAARFTSTYNVGTGDGVTIKWYKGSGDEWNGKTPFVNSNLVAGSEHVETIMDLPGREDGNGYMVAWAKPLGIDLVGGANTTHSSIGSGFIMAPVTGEYEFKLGGGFGKLQIGDVEVYNEFRFNENERDKKTVKLKLIAGTKYKFYFERHGYAPGGIQITWRTTDGKLPTQKIPTSQLYSK